MWVASGETWLPVGIAIEWSARTRRSVTAEQFFGTETGGTEVAILGEPLQAAAIAAAMNLAHPGTARALSPLPSLGINAPILSTNLSEDMIRETLRGTRVLATDPLFDLIAEEANVQRTVPFPHEACLGRMYRHLMVNPFDQRDLTGFFDKIFAE